MSSYHHKTGAQKRKEDQCVLKESKDRRRFNSMHGFDVTDRERNQCSSVHECESNDSSLHQIPKLLLKD